MTSSVLVVKLNYHLAMESVVQLVLISSIFSLTIIFIVVGVWVVLILRDIRTVTRKIGQVGDEVGDMASFVKKKIKDGFSLVALLTALSSIWGEKGKIGDFIEELKERKVKREKNSTEEEVIEEEKPKEKKTKSKHRLFFKKRS